MDIQNMTVGELNKVLEDRLTLLGEKSDSKVIQNISIELNDILYSAIIYHAPDVNAVQIQTSADLSRAYNDLPMDGYRTTRLKDYIQKATGQEGLKGAVPFLFTMHLPFTFTTRTHGSGERGAMFSSIDNMAFEPYTIDAPAYFQLDLGSGPWISKQEVYFLPQEINSVRLAQVEDSEFSQIYKDREKPLEQSHSALEHYLLFKGFLPYPVNVNYIPQGKWKKEILPLLGKISVPEFSTGLLKTVEVEQKGLVDMILQRQLLSGFAAIESKEGTEVYEFDKVMLPKGLAKDYFYGHQVAHAAYAICLHRESPQPNIKVYTGNDAIARLHEFKTEKRF